MKTIPDTFTKSGWHHKLLHRTRGIAVFERWKDSSPSPHFEVIRIVIQPATEIQGHAIEEGEKYPGSSQFGTMAWSYPTLDKAMVKFAELTKVVPKKIKKKTS